MTIYDDVSIVKFCGWESFSRGVSLVVDVPQ